MKLRLGTLCLFENPSDEAGRALIRQFVLVREADRMGYDDIWLAERHGDARRPSTAITTLLGHLAGVSSKARIGAIVQPGGRQPERLAEDLATAELLSRGRLALAADALGADAAFAIDAMAAVRAALAGEAAPLLPRSSGTLLPSWAVADRSEAARHAAARGLGLWLPAETTQAEVAALIEVHRDSSPAAALPGPLLTRYACPAATGEEASAMARPFVQALVGEARSEALLAQSLVGSHAEVAAQIRALGERFGLAGVVIAPMSANFDTAKHILADMVDEVRPLLDD
jgi:alkanesulfonate monooxygenase SsuD/methylene tetrahydromethanopterin reductase-like flavin-dependent oxidoreductase (luciferase family)